MAEAGRPGEEGQGRGGQKKGGSNKGKDFLKLPELEKREHKRGGNMAGKKIKENGKGEKRKIRNQRRRPIRKKTKLKVYAQTRQKQRHR